MTRSRRESRRWFLGLAGTAAVAGIAGCSGDDGGSDGSGTGGAETDRAEAEPDGGGGSGGSLGPVPEEYVTATAQDGTERSPDSVASKEAVRYQSEPKDGAQCTGCRFYVPDRNGDGLGACAVVAGEIEPGAWCSSYVEYEG
jgi:hypothetical protein